jgi:hypothetical protein
MAVKRGWAMGFALLLLGPSAVFAQQSKQVDTSWLLNGPSRTKAPIASCRKAAADAMKSSGYAVLALANGKDATQAECHGTTPCPQPKSCGSWSSYFNCSAPFCEQDDPGCGGGPATYQAKERFRACTLAGGTMCTEYESIAQRLHCGC